MKDLIDMVFELFTQNHTTSRFREMFLLGRIKKIELFSRKSYCHYASSARKSDRGSRVDDEAGIKMWRRGWHLHPKHLEIGKIDARSAP